MLIVHYENLKHFDKGFKKDEHKKQADTLGWLMMSVGVLKLQKRLSMKYFSELNI